MLFLKNSIKPLLFILLTILIFTFIVTIFNYFDLINYKGISIIKIIIPILAFIIGGFIIGKRSPSKGWLAGFKIGLIFLLLLTLFNYLGLKHKPKGINFIYYSILLFSAMGGSMIGINKKTN